MMFDALRDPEQLGSFELIEERDYTDPPKASGYRACHVILRIPSDQGAPVFAEIQVKTRLQDAWGELTHEDMYKPGAAMKPSKLHGEFARAMANMLATRSEEHTSELQSRGHLVCRLLLEKKQSEIN